MNPYTHQKLTESLSKTNHQLTIDDFDDIQALDRIADEIGGAVELVETLKDYIDAFGKSFMRPTLLRADLIDRLVKAYHLPTWHFIGTLWILDSEREPDELKSPPTKEAMKAYRKTLDCSMRDMARIINELLAVKESDDAEEIGTKKSVSVQRVACIMAMSVGGSPEEWMDAPMSRIVEAGKIIDERNQAQLDSANRGGKRVTAPTPTPKLCAMAEFRDKLKSMERKWLAT